MILANEVQDPRAFVVNPLGSRHCVDRLPVFSPAYMIAVIYRYWGSRMLSSFPGKWRSHGLNLSCLSSPFPPSTWSFRKNCLFPEKVEHVGSFLAVACRSGSMWPITPRLPTLQLWLAGPLPNLPAWLSPACPPGVCCLPAGRSDGPLESGATLLIPLGFPHTLLSAPGAPAAFSCNVPICSGLSASPSPLIIPLLSSLHLPNKIKLKTKQ